jgi:serine/threonine protein kinase
MRFGSAQDRALDSDATELSSNEARSPDYAVSYVDDDDIPCCSCSCWPRLRSSSDAERGPLVSSRVCNGKSSLQQSSARRLFRMRWGRTSPTIPHEAGQLEEGIAFRFLGGQYKLQKEAGRGAHCVVWQSHRVSGGAEPLALALKVHNKDGAKSALKRESNALKALRATASGAPVFPHLLGTVRLEGHVALAMPLYGPDLYQLQKAHDRKPFPSTFVWALAEQLLNALVALEEVELVHVCHTHLASHAALHARCLYATAEMRECVCAGGHQATKHLAPEHEGQHAQRIHAHRPDRSRLLPLTAAPEQFISAHHLHTKPMVPCTRGENACRSSPSLPCAHSTASSDLALQVILCSPITNAADTWSVGCVIAEAALGVPLLPGESEYNQIVRTVDMIGAPPRAVMLTALRGDQFFRGPFGRTWATADEQYRVRTDRVQSEPTLVHYLPCTELRPLLQHILRGMGNEERGVLLKLLDGILRWQPDYRWSAQYALARLWSPTSSSGRNCSTTNRI